MNDNDTKWNVAKWTQILLILGLIAGGANFAYNEWYKIPKLTYETLDAYPLSNDEQIIPIIIRNEGHEKATNVRITIYSGGEITKVQEKTPENLKFELNNNTLIAELPRLVDDSQITLFFQIKTMSQKPINEIYIASDEGSGGIHETSSTSDFVLKILVLIAVSIAIATLVFEMIKEGKKISHFNKKE